MTDVRWVFLRPRNHSPYYDPEIQEPLGLEYLAASRCAVGDAVLVLDAALDAASDTRLGRRTAAFQPDAVGFSLTTLQEVASLLAIFRECRTALGGRNVSWLAGGNFVSTETSHASALLPDEFRLVPYEGEAALEDIAAGWRSAGVVGTPGCRDRVFPGRPVADLDALHHPLRPFADRVLQAGWAFNLQASRGCCGRCRFCASPGMARDGVNRWRGRSPANLAEEMEALHRAYGAASFNLVDEDFLGPPAMAESRARQFAEELRRRGLRLSFGIQVRPTSLSDAVIDALTAAGLTYMFMGLESDDPADLRRWGRPAASDPWRWVEQLRQRGAEINVGVMLFHPHSTLAGVRRFAEQLHRHRLLEFRAATNRLDAMPGSEYHRRALAEGVIAADVAGPQPLPFREAAVGALHQDLVLATEPLGPPSMHAICSLPPLLARRWLDARCTPAVHQLQETIAALDAATALSVFSLLDAHEHRRGLPGLVADLRRQNLSVALAASDELARRGFVSSSDVLREAIRIDAGM